jgi:hypothetical protein
MTDSQWLRGHDMLGMLRHANGCAGNRKLRLFACACCRRFFHLLPSDEARHALACAEGAADGTVKFAEMAAARRAFAVLRPRTAREWASNSASFAATRSAKEAALAAYSTSAEVVRALGQPYEAHEPYYADLLRDIVGNPFRPRALAAAWRTATVTALARAAYEERLLPEGSLGPARLAVLADALEEAGCTDGELLAHLRGSGPHVRGCWVLDLILPKGR